LKSPVWTTVPASVVIASAVASAIECVTRIGSKRERADLERMPRLRLDEMRVREDLVLAEALAHEAERVLRRPDRQHL